MGTMANSTSPAVARMLTPAPNPDLRSQTPSHLPTSAPGNNSLLYGAAHKTIDGHQDRAKYQKAAEEHNGVDEDSRIAKRPHISERVEVPTRQGTVQQRVNGVSGRVDQPAWRQVPFQCSFWNIKTPEENVQKGDDAVEGHIRHTLQAGWVP